MLRFDILDMKEANYSWNIIVLEMNLWLWSMRRSMCEVWGTNWGQWRYQWSVMECAYIYGNNKSVLVNSKPRTHNWRRSQTLWLFIMFVKVLILMNGRLLIPIRMKKLLTWWLRICPLESREQSFVRCCCTFLRQVLRLVKKPINTQQLLLWGSYLVCGLKQ